MNTESPEDSARDAYVGASITANTALEDAYNAYCQAALAWDTALAEYHQARIARDTASIRHALAYDAWCATGDAFYAHKTANDNANRDLVGNRHQCGPVRNRATHGP